MKLYTSCYSMMNKIPADFLMVGISRFIPKELRTTSISNFLYTPNNILAPSVDLLNDIKGERITNDEYAKRYYKEIQDRMKSLGYSSANEYFAKMVSALDQTNSDGFRATVFLCYEKPDEFCHRHLLSALMRKLGFDITEWRPSSKTIQSKEELSSSALF